MDRSDVLWRDGADSYSSSVRLPSGGAGETRAAGAAYGERIRALAGECFPAIKGYSVEFDAASPERTSGKIVLRDFEASFRISGGQDKSYGADGQLHACSTLALDAEARIISLGRAEKAGEGVAALFALIGAVAFGALFFFLRRLALEAMGMVVYPSRLVILFPAAGLIAGGAAGLVVGGFVARRLGARTARDETVVGAAADWDAFVTRAGRLLENMKA